MPAGVWEIPPPTNYHPVVNFLYTEGIMAGVLKNQKWEEFCKNTIKGLSPVDAYVYAGYKRAGAAQGASQLKKKPEVQSRLRELRNEISDKIVTEIAKFTIGNRASRIEALQDLADRLKRVMDERAVDPAVQNVPGGKTGLVVLQERAIGMGANPRTVLDAKVDTATAQLFTSILQQAAKDCGQWSEKVDATIKWDGDINSLNADQRKKMLDQLAEIAFAGDQAALEAARAEAEVLANQKLLVQ